MLAPAKSAFRHQDQAPLVSRRRPWFEQIDLEVEFLLREPAAIFVVKDDLKGHLLEAPIERLGCVRIVGLSGHDFQQVDRSPPPCLCRGSLPWRVERPFSIALTTTLPPGFTCIAVASSSRRLGSHAGKSHCRRASGGLDFMANPPRTAFDTRAAMMSAVVLASMCLSLRCLKMAGARLSRSPKPSFQTLSSKTSIAAWCRPDCASMSAISMTSSYSFPASEVYGERGLSTDDDGPGQSTTVVDGPAEFHQLHPGTKSQSSSNDGGDVASIFADPG